MKWQDRQRSTNIIDTINDPVAKMMLDELLLYTAPPDYRQREVDWAKPSLDAIKSGDVGIPLSTYDTTPSGDRKSPGGYVRRYGSPNVILGVDGAVNPYYDKKPIPQANVRRVKDE